MEKTSVAASWSAAGGTASVKNPFPETRADSHSGAFPLRLAREGDLVRIVGLNGGSGFRGRLSGIGLRTGACIHVIRNSSCGKILVDHEGTRLFLGGGMAHKIQVVPVKGGGR